MTWTGLKRNDLVQESTSAVHIEYRPVLAQWDVYIVGWGSGGGRRFFGRYEQFVQAQAAAVVAQHEFDWHRPK